MKAGEVARPFGDDVDDAQHGVGAVEDRTWAKDDLDVIDHLDRHPSPSPEPSGAEEGIVLGMAIDEQQEVIAVVRWQKYAPRADVDPAERIGGRRAEG